MAYEYVDSVKSDQSDLGQTLTRDVDVNVDPYYQEAWFIGDGGMMLFILDEPELKKLHKIIRTCLDILKQRKTSKNSQ